MPCECLPVMPPTLPSESWDGIITLLPPASQRACLFVSRQLHDVALRILFRTLAIDLGVWEELTPANALEDGDERADVIRSQASTRTTEILARITQDSEFAINVRQLSMLSYMQQDALDEKRKR